jgi:hypothetical protein
MDDYCLQNRNIIRKDFGYLYCLDFLSDMPPDTWLVNQHIRKLFRFSPDQIQFMKNKVEERAIILSDLSPWPDLNYAIDEQWARFYPYGMNVSRGREYNLDVIITNHQADSCDYTITPQLPGNDLSVQPPTATITIPPHSEGKASFTMSINPDAANGVKLVTADIAFGDHHLHEWCEAIIEVK